MECYRGDIFFITGSGGKINGSEQKQDRPAVIVSNDKANEHSPVIEVVFLTSAEKPRYLPTHVEVMCQIPSVALCEQVNSIAKSRLGDYVRTCNEKEMAEIDRALMISLGINQQPKEQVVATSGMIDDLKMKLEGAERKMDEENIQYQKLFCEYTCTREQLDELIAENGRLLRDKGELNKMLKNAESQVPVFPVEIEKELLKAETQRDMYKELYEQMLEKMIG